MPSYSKYPIAIEYTKDDFLTGKLPNGEVRHFTSDAVLEFMKTWLPDLEVSFNNVESITFDTTNEATPAIGEIAWNDSDGTIVIGVVGGSIKIQTIDKEIHAATTKTTPIDTDEWGVWDSVNSALRKVTWANIKSTLKTYFDTIYQAVLVSGTNIKTINSESILGSGNIEIDADNTITIQTKTAAFNLVSGDEETYIRYTGASDINVTVPNTLRIGQPITIWQAGAGVITLVGDTSVVLNGDLKTAGQNRGIQIMKVADNLFDVIGGVA
jgi:hypothetical protein